MDLNILYSDKDITVCVKPSGILSEGEGDDSMPYLLSKATERKIFPVHRLDRETSGLMVYAHNSASAAGLSKSITDGSFKKEYIAIILGCPENTQGTLRDLLFYDRRQGRSYTVTRQRKGVKDAELDYEILKKHDSFSLVHITLKTGRTHQIRVQFASRKMPLMGDKRYGARDGGKELKLYSYKISFEHPITKEPLSFSSLPEWAKSETEI